MAKPMQGINLSQQSYVEMVDKGGNLCRIPYGPRFADGKDGDEGRVLAIHRLEAKGFVKPGSPEAEARRAKTARKPVEAKPSK